MRQPMVGLRALGEALLWGTFGGAVYLLMVGVLLDGFDEVMRETLAIVMVGMAFGLLAGSWAQHCRRSASAVCAGSSWTRTLG